ncbi:TadE family type IV pilus minor pilin [Georgenia muralis]|nr:TadE family type IV pilus minor pilin [Georgenia muralis]
MPDGSPRPAPGAGAQAGMVTAELALVLPAVVMVLLLLLTAGSAALTQVRVADAARAGARAAALGEPAAVVARVAEDLAGERARVLVAQDGAYVLVEVTSDLPGVLGLTDLRARSQARALPEPGT